MKSIERHAGTGAPAVAFGGILIAAMLDPTFSWTGDALSDLGVREESAALFNTSLIVGGVLGSLYGSGVSRWADSTPGRIAGIAFAMASVALVGVGLFVAGHPLHLPAAIGFYVLFTVAFALDGLSRVDALTGRVTLGLVVVHVLVWATWGASFWPGPGLALPEFVGGVLVAVWVWFVGPFPTIGFDEHIDWDGQADQP